MPRPIRRAVREPHVTDDDIKVALKMEAKGTPVPESLKPALAEYKKSNPDKYPVDKGNDEDEEKDKDEEEDDDTPDDSKEKTGDDSDDEDESKSKKKPSGKGDDDDEEDDSEDDESEDEDDDDESSSPANKSRRPVRHIPIKEFKETKRQWKTREGELVTEVDGLKKQIETLSKSKGEDSKKEFEAKLAEIAEKTGFAKDDLKTLTDFILGQAAIPADLIEKLKKAGDAAPPKPNDAPPAKSKEQQEKEMWKKQDERFDSEMTTALAEPGADPEMGNHKKALKKLAFTKGYETKSIWELWTRFVKPKADKAKKGVDTPGAQPGAGGGDNVDFAALSADPVKQREFLRGATIKQKEEFTEYMGRQGAGQRVRRNGKPLN